MNLINTIVLDSSTEILVILQKQHLIELLIIFSSSYLN